ncbi:MAG: hypothetical protein ABEJ67_00580 [Halanaeroarchaeum sp.]
MDVSTLTAVDLLELVVSLLGAVGFTIGGLLAETDGVANLLAGQTALGGWEVWMGAVALFAGLYLLGYRHVVRRLVADATA